MFDLLSTRLGRSKQFAIWTLIFALSTTGFVPGATRNMDLSSLPSSPTSPIDAHTFVLATNGEANTLDPALAYDTASGEIIQNVYETLVFYDGVNTNAFVPQLANSYELSPDGLTWTFHIRQGVSFHNGASLTPTDVAYSFQRGLLQGGSSSPQWLLAEPFFGIGISDVSILVDPTGGLMDNRVALSAWNPTDLVNACQQVQSAIVADNVAGTVTMHLKQPWGPFLGTIAQTWGSIIDQDWTIAQGGWDGSCNTWQNWYATNSGEDPLTAVANGTGPFMLDHWTLGTETVLSRNNGYWNTPAKLERVKILIVPDDNARFAMLQSGDADQIVMPSGNRAQADTMSGEDCVWDISTAQYNCSIVDTTQPLRRYIGRPGLSQDTVLLNFNIDNTAGSNPYIGSGQLDGNGIPTDFFSDVHIRKAFNYCFDWNSYIQNAFGGEFAQAITLPLEGMPGYDLSAPHYTFNLTDCQNEFGLADLDHDGIPSSGDTNDVTQVGFHFKMLYNQGNTSRQIVAEILAAKLVQVNPKFLVDVVSLPWTEYLAAQRASRLPIMTAGWLEDIHDPHNWYQPYLVGVYASRGRISDALKAQFSALIDQGVTATDFTARHVIYQQLNQLIYDNAPFIMLGGATSHNFIQRRVNGRALNPIFPGNYYYTIYKYVISGNLGANGAGATVSYTGGSTIADGAGDYAFNFIYNWSGTVTPSKTGYTFSPVSKDYVNVTDNVINENYSATQNDYVLTIISANGTVTKNPNKAFYHEGDVVLLTATPSAGWKFVSWSGGLTGAVNPGSITIHGNTAVTANFKKINTLNLNSISAQDGWILETGENTTVGGTLNAGTTTFVLGDNALKKQYRSILSFTTGGLPDNAVITSVTLKIKPQLPSVGGATPSMFQGFLVDIRNGFFGTSALQVTDFQAAASTPLAGIAPVTTTVGGWYTFNLTASKGFINKLPGNAGLTQFRLRFKLDDNNNAIANYISFYSGNSLVNKPTLTIQYYVP